MACSGVHAPHISHMETPRPRGATDLLLQCTETEAGLSCVFVGNPAGSPVSLPGRGLGDAMSLLTPPQALSVLIYPWKTRQKGVCQELRQLPGCSLGVGFQLSRILPEAERKNRKLCLGATPHPHKSSCTPARDCILRDKNRTCPFSLLEQARPWLQEAGPAPTPRSVEVPPV